MKALLSILVVGGLLLASCDKALQEVKTNTKASSLGESNTTIGGQRFHIDNFVEFCLSNCDELGIDTLSVFSEEITLTEPSDVLLTLEDCCVACDLYEIYVNGCLVGTVDTRGEEAPQQPDIVYEFPVTLPAGDHIVSYKLAETFCEGAAAFVETIIVGPTTTELTTHFGACSAGIPDYTVCSGGVAMTMTEVIEQCALNGSNHGAIVSCVAAACNEWKSLGIIDGNDEGQIMACAANKWPL